MDHLYGLPDLAQLMPEKSFSPATLHGSNHLIPSMIPPIYNDKTSCWLEVREEYNCDQEDINKSRWGRQETLTLLEVRSLLHHNFKDSTVLKAPLWDQVSRIMREEHGYHRSGKKCKEKFENLYKYYKKTKENKNGRQDGKTYRFFRQLEALCGDPPSNTETLHGGTDIFDPTSTIQHNFQNNMIHENLSHLNVREFKTSPISRKNDTCDLSAAMFAGKKKKKIVNKKQMKSIESYIESRMGVLMERQDVCMEKIINIIEYKECVNANKEDEWRKEVSTRFDHEYGILTQRRAFSEARDTKLIEALQDLANNEVRRDQIKEAPNMFDLYEISSLMQIRSSMESKFQEFGNFAEDLWEEVARKMELLGYGFGAKKCKDTWENMRCNGQDYLSLHGSFLKGKMNGNGHIDNL